jgi:para-aminobenzoate synthetase component 1
LEYSFGKKVRVETDREAFLQRVISACRSYDHFALYLTSEEEFALHLGISARYVELYETLGAFEILRSFHRDSNREICGYLGYDLKNDLEKLESKNPSAIRTPETAFFESSLRLKFQNEMVEVDGMDESHIDSLLHQLGLEPKLSQGLSGVNPISDTLEDDYLQAVGQLKNHLQRGDIYEANYCIQFVAEANDFCPYSGFYSLWKRTKAPFSVFAKLNDVFVLSASPERYLKRDGEELISQPIKGTIKRSTDPIVDKELMRSLSNDTKEKSENVMIVDLVRNDLSRIAQRGSVKVRELHEVYSFKTVHHLISTVEAKLKEGYGSWDAIRATFPMGSMTGAPKISAMKLIETYEHFKRGIYSGAFGIMKPDGNFDFNVLIRTLVFDNTTRKITFGVGSAITIKADSKKEWNECMLKADALIKSLRLPDIHEPREEIQS